PGEPEESGRIYEVSVRRDSRVELQFGNGAVRFGRIRPGDLVWRTHDPDLEQVARVFTHAATPVSRQRVRVQATAAEGSPFVTVWSLEKQPDRRVTVQSSVPL